MNLTRRSFLASAAVAATGSLPAASAETPRSRPPKRSKPAAKTIALITTKYHYTSHAHHIAGRFLEGYMDNGKHRFPDFTLASAFVEQVGKDDISRDVMKAYNVRVSATPEDALTLGTGKLAVDAVLLVAEHGDYPHNEKGQELYPRHPWFLRIAKVMEASDRVAPVFCDKHLSYDRRKALEMVETARKLKIPFMAGSSLPVTYRKPELELPLGSKITDAILASRGECERYGIHALEALQAMIERRFKGPAQQGVKVVTCLHGDAVFKAGDDGVWSWDLLEHALGRSESRNVGDVRDNCKRFYPSSLWKSGLVGPHAFVVEYRDGLKATVLQLDGHVGDETFACRIEGEAKRRSTLFVLPAPPGAGFLEVLARRVETFFETGKPTYPVERTLLTSGILDYAMESRFRRSARLESPDLDVTYAAPEDSGYMRGTYADPVK